MEITAKRLEELEKIERKMCALEAGGVDNWEWYDESLKEFRKEEDIQETLSDLFTEMCTALSMGAYEPSERGAGFAFNSDAEEEAERMLHTKFYELLKEHSGE